jgi:hypothetical protein
MVAWRGTGISGAARRPLASEDGSGRSLVLARARGALVGLFGVGVG